MKKKNPRGAVLCLIAGLLTLYSCKEIIEPSIAIKQVQLLAPVDHYQSARYHVDFWFEEVEDALYYRLQVVSPRFDSTERLVADTLIKSPKFSMDIDPGKYAWRVRAENGSSQTAYSVPSSFDIYFSSIKQQKAQLLSPGNNALTNQSSIALKWGDLFGATKYLLQVDTNNFMDEENLVYHQTTQALQMILTLENDQHYQWRVRAENDTAQSQWSSINRFTYDHTPPAKVTLLSPAKAQTVGLPVSLKWDPVIPAKKYKLYVLKSDSTLYDQRFPVTLNNVTNYSFDKGAFNELIYWKVSAIDEAGNEGPASELRNFIVNQ